MRANLLMKNSAHYERGEQVEQDMPQQHVIHLQRRGLNTLHGAYEARNDARVHTTTVFSDH
jgi:hypothetical protein